MKILSRVKCIRIAFIEKVFHEVFQKLKYQFEKHLRMAEHFPLDYVSFSNYDHQ